MRKILALLIVAIATLTSQPTWAADLNSPNGYISFAFGEDLHRVGYGPSKEEAIADAMRKCLQQTDICAGGVATPPEWHHALMWCPELALTGIAVSPDKEKKEIDDAVVAQLGWDYINFKCVVIGGDWKDQPVVSWLMNTH